MDGRPSRGDGAGKGKRTPLPELAEITSRFKAAFRESRFDTQTQLVRETDLAQGEVSEMLSGTARRGPEAYRRLADALGIPRKTVDEWLTEVDERLERTATVAVPVSVEPPFGILPPHLRGRSKLWAEMRRRLTSPAARMLVLHGMGGSGKSALALELARFAKDRAFRVWWVPALDEDTMVAHLYEVAVSLGATTQDVARARAAGTGPHMLWRLLEGLDEPWLLVFDGADELPTTGNGAVADGTGWIRASGRGLVLVTTRDSNPHLWGNRANRRPVKALDRVDGAKVLLDHAPGAGSEEEAGDLAERVGGVPLALHLIGSYLRMSAGAATTFTQYHVELDRRSAEFLDIAGPRGARAGQDKASLRQLIMHTWELSLDALGAQGLPATRPLLRLLAGFAPIQLPVNALDPNLLQGRAGAEQTGQSAQEVFAPMDPPGEDERDRLLAALADMGLIDIGRTSANVRWLQLHALVAEVSNLHLKKDPERTRATTLLVHCLLYDYDEHHKPSEPENWPLWTMLVPHVRYLLDHAPKDLDDTLRTSLVWACEQAANYLNRSGEPSAASRIVAQAKGMTEPKTSIGKSRQWSRTLSKIQRANQDTRLAEYSRDPQERIRLATRALRQGISTPGFPPEYLIRSAQMRVAGLLGAGSVARAEREVDEYVELSESCLGPEHWNTVDLRFTRAAIWMQRGEMRKAADELRDLLNLTSQHPGEAGDEAAIRNNLAAALAELGCFPEAEAHAREALGARIQKFGNDHPETFRSRMVLSTILGLRGSPEEAVEELDDTLARARRQLESGHPIIRALRLSHAEALAWAGRLDEAAKELAELEPETAPFKESLMHLKVKHLVERWQREGIPPHEERVSRKGDEELAGVLLSAIREENSRIVMKNTRAGIPTPPWETVPDGIREREGHPIFSFRSPEDGSLGGKIAKALLDGTSSFPEGLPPELAEHRDLLVSKAAEIYATTELSIRNYMDAAQVTEEVAQGWVKEDAAIGSTIVSAMDDLLAERGEDIWHESVGDDPIAHAIQYTFTRFKTSLTLGADFRANRLEKEGEARGG
ncbi:tetratricopeptide repeat protein [Streptomyces sp. NPDC059862]|uniref:tetratricopeptide repeat protein n=1 Tax=Streptomyces sp. NPDC059862 TaxID=3346975 RepID=UPI003648DC89